MSASVSRVAIVTGPAWASGVEARFYHWREKPTHEMHGTGKKSAGIASF